MKGTQVQTLVGRLQDKYSAEDLPLPEEIRRQIGAVVNLKEEFETDVNEQEEKLLQVKTARLEYQTSIQIIEAWLRSASVEKSSDMSRGLDNHLKMQKVSGYILA